MIRRSILTIAALSLFGCGPGDQLPARVDNASLPASDTRDSADLSAEFPLAASDPIASAQASLDADSHQVTPVLSYAPDADDNAAARH